MHNDTHNLNFEVHKLSLTYVTIVSKNWRRMNQEKREQVE